jgi:hypothetical protein
MDIFPTRMDATMVLAAGPATFDRRQQRQRAALPCLAGA